MNKPLLALGALGILVVGGLALASDGDVGKAIKPATPKPSGGGAPKPTPKPPAQQGLPEMMLPDGSINPLWWEKIGQYIEHPETNPTPIPGGWQDTGAPPSDDWGGIGDDGITDWLGTGQEGSGEPGDWGNPPGLDDDDFWGDEDGE